MNLKAKLPLHPQALSQFLIMKGKYGACEMEQANYMHVQRVVGLIQALAALVTPKSSANRKIFWIYSRNYISLNTLTPEHNKPLDSCFCSLKDLKTSFIQQKYEDQAAIAT